MHVNPALRERDTDPSLAEMQLHRSGRVPLHPTLQSVLSTWPHLPSDEKRIRSIAIKNLELEIGHVAKVGARWPSHLNQPDTFLESQLVT